MEKTINTGWLDETVSKTGLLKCTDLIESTSEDVKFNIPEVNLHREDDVSLGLLVELTPAIADILFPRGSWPWTFTREAAFYFTDRVESYDLREEMRKELNSTLQSVMIGPVGRMSATLVTNQWLSQPFAKQLAAWARESLNENSFAEDIKLFVRGDNGSMKVVEQAVKLVDSLSEEERAILLAELPATWSQVLDSLIARREAYPSEEPVKAVEAVLIESWRNGLSEYFSEKLDNLSADVPIHAPVEAPLKE